MAKYIIEYEIHVGDTVAFETDPSKPCQRGIVQDISQLPDIWVEGFEDGKYTRWCRGIDSLEVISSEHDSGVHTSGEFEEHEVFDFVHKGDVGTPEFKELIYSHF